MKSSKKIETRDNRTKWSESTVQGIFERADKQREIVRYLQEALFEKATEKQCLCTWVIEYPVPEGNVFAFRLAVTSVDAHHQVRKDFSVTYEWEKEKDRMRAIASELIGQLDDQTKSRFEDK